MLASGILSVVSLSEQGGRLVGVGNMRRHQRFNEDDKVEIVLITTNEKQKSYFTAGAMYYASGEVCIEDGKLVLYIESFSKVNNNAFFGENNPQVAKQSGLLANGFFRGNSSYSKPSYGNQPQAQPQVQTQPKTPADGGYVPPRKASGYVPPAYQKPVQQAPAQGYVPPKPAPTQAYVPPVPPQVPAYTPPVQRTTNQQPEVANAHIEEQNAIQEAPTYVPPTPQQTTPAPQQETVGEDLKDIEI